MATPASVIPDIISRFAVSYQETMKNLTALKLSGDDLHNRLNTFQNLAGGGELNSYVDQTLNDQGVRDWLQKINLRLTHRISTRSDVDENIDNLKDIINDLLISSSLVPVRYENGNRQALEVLSPAALTVVLAKVAKDLAELSPMTSGLGDIRYKPEGQLSERLARLALLNMAPDVRKGIVENPLFEQIVTSSNAADFMFAANVREGQQFLNTCISASVHNYIRTQTPTIIGLLEVGKKLADKIQAKLDASPAEVKNKKYEGRTVERHVGSRISQAREVFAYIEREVAKTTSDTSSLTAREKAKVLLDLNGVWGRVMQKLEAVQDFSDEFPKLTNKGHRDSYEMSLVLSLPKVFHEPRRRLTGMPEDHISKVSESVLARPLTGTYIQASVCHRDHHDDLTDAEWGKRLWNAVAYDHACVLMHGHHALYLRASGEFEFTIVETKRYSSKSDITFKAKEARSKLKGFEIPTDICHRMTSAAPRASGEIPSWEDVAVRVTISF
ncbi:hypothetical protein SSP24_80250 [Streptomyces spinoverrucosus]|uniref:Uncharacterized protein n=1 Tax=Streptomyces spinoverrucosus TaxID=284043 RepID=A0A4Y3VXJ7_9ACTN|nr:hypothetical protein [Streptomyces spinoverrucosus]GEC10370.1 hypothetical protein SSP24_80250 [Streptomyces spinoverrucosus]GHB98441.1 hypothetical protein GCM10010397_83590 [Streptomyces spinoverrucosus]